MVLEWEMAVEADTKAQYSKPTGKGQHVCDPRPWGRAGRLCEQGTPFLTIPNLQTLSKSDKSENKKPVYFLEILLHKCSLT